MRRTILTLVFAAIVAAPAAAQQLTLSFGEEGRVSVDATSVPVRTILTKWAELGGTKVVGAERVSGAPLSIKLTDVPESQALEIILRSVAGYMAAPRATGTGASRYDRILILATSSVPAPVANTPRTNAPTPNGMNGTQRFIPPQRQQPSEDDEPADEPDPNPPNPPVFTFPQPGQQPAGGLAQPGMPANVPMMINGQPVTTFNPVNGVQGVTINPATPTYQAPGTFGSPVPGMIQAPPPPQPGTQPVQIIRPPGGNRQY